MTELAHGLLPIELMIDHAEVDSQHDEIFSRIEAMKESSLLSDAASHDDVASLITCFADHFATEERLAREAGIEFSAHVREHDQALRLLNKAFVDLGSGRLDLRTFLRYLEFWFEQHINEFDKPLGNRLSGRSSGARMRHGDSSSVGRGGFGLNA